MMKPDFIFPIAKLSFAVAVLLYLFSSCSSSYGNIEGHYINRNIDQSKEVGDIDFANLSNKVALTAFEKDYFIDFFSSGKYTMNLYQYENGSYDYRAGKVILYPENGEKWELGFKLNEDNSAEFTFPKANKSKFKKVSLSRMEHQYKADYPYAALFNEWRIKPSRELSNNELIEKLQNHLRFMQAYLTWAKKVGLEMDLKLMSGPLRYGNDGFTMRRLSSTGKWCDYFDEGDCQEMDYIIRNQFEKLEIEWNFTHDRIAMLGDALGQLINELNNQKENFDQ